VSGFSRIRWWLAPIAATAAAVTIWMVVPRENAAPRQATPQQESKMADAREVAVPSAKPAEEAAPPPAAPPADAPPPTPERQRLLESERAQRGAVADAASQDQDAAAKRENTLARANEAAPAAPPPAAAASPAAAAPATAEAFRERREKPAALAESVAVTQSPSATIEVISPNPASRWRVAQGFLERSEDGGASWLPMRPVGPDQIRAGSSPSRLVCWLVGTRGLVMLATDGTNFTRLPFPEQTDLVTVSATSAASAAITTSDGRTFVTADAGRTWNPR
jgi:hypothetical protein